MVALSYRGCEVRIGLCWGVQQVTVRNEWPCTVPPTLHPGVSCTLFPRRLFGNRAFSVHHGTARRWYSCRNKALTLRFKRFWGNVSLRVVRGRLVCAMSRIEASSLSCSSTASVSAGSKEMRKRWWHLNAKTLIASQRENTDCIWMRYLRITKKWFFNLHPGGFGGKTKYQRKSSGRRNSVG